MEDKIQNAVAPDFDHIVSQMVGDAGIDHPYYVKNKISKAELSELLLANFTVSIRECNLVGICQNIKT